MTELVKTRAGIFCPLRLYPLVDIGREDYRGAVMLDNIGCVNVIAIGPQGTVLFCTQTGESKSMEGNKFLENFVVCDKNDEKKRNAIRHLIDLNSVVEEPEQTQFVKKKITIGNCVLSLLKYNDKSMLCSTNLETKTTEVISETTRDELVVDFCVYENTIYYLTEERGEMEVRNRLYWRSEKNTKWFTTNWYTGRMHPKSSSEKKMICYKNLVFINCDAWMRNSCEQEINAVFVVNIFDLTVEKVLINEFIYEWELLGDKIYYTKSFCCSPDDSIELACYNILTAEIAKIDTGNMSNLCVQYSGIFYSEDDDYGGIYHNIMTEKGELRESIRIDKHRNGMVLDDALYSCEKINGKEMLCCKNLVTGENRVVFTSEQYMIGKVVLDKHYAIVEMLVADDKTTVHYAPDKVILIDLLADKVIQLLTIERERQPMEEEQIRIQEVDAEGMVSTNEDCIADFKLDKKDLSEEEMNKRGLFRVTFQGPRFISYKTFQGIPYTTSPDREIINGYVVIGHTTHQHGYYGSDREDNFAIDKWGNENTCLFEDSYSLSDEYNTDDFDEWS